MPQQISRRRFLAFAAVAAAAAPVLAALPAQAAVPAATPAAAKTPLPKLPLTDPAAKALTYTENAAAAKHANFKAGSQCANCNLYKGAKGQAFGPCTIFPKNTVAAKGWCSAWVKKP
jgi:hypothetical protein